MRRIWRRIAEVSAARIYSLSISTLIVIVTARALGPASQGVFAASLTWVTLFANFSSLSLEQVAQFRIQLSRGSDWFPKICGTLLFLGALLSGIALTAALILQYFLPYVLFRNIPPLVLSFAFLLLPLFILEQYLSSLLAAANHVNWYIKAQYAGRSLWLLLTAIFLWVFEFNVHHAIAAQLCGQLLLVAIAAIGLTRGSPKKIIIDSKEARELIKGSLKLHLNSVGSFVLGQSSVLFLNYFSTTAEVAWYQVATQIIMSFLFIPYAASTIFYSRIAESGPDQFWHEQKKIISVVIAVLAVISVVAFFAAPWAIHCFLGNQYAPAIPILRWLLPTVIGLSFSQMMTPQWISRGKFLWTSSATVMAAVLNLIANALLIPRFGIMGAVWVSLFTYLGLTVAFQFTFACWCEAKSRNTQKC